jgi:hypothetical protein
VPASQGMKYCNKNPAIHVTHERVQDLYIYILTQISNHTSVFNQDGEHSSGVKDQYTLTPM